MRREEFTVGNETYVVLTPTHVHFFEKYFFFLTIIMVVLVIIGSV